MRCKLNPCTHPLAWTSSDCGLTIMLLQALKVWSNLRLKQRKNKKLGQSKSESSRLFMRAHL